jgi:hypothetical protein
MRVRVTPLDRPLSLFDVIEDAQTLAEPQAGREPEAAAAFALTTWLLLRREKWWARTAARLYETVSPAVVFGLSLVPVIGPSPVEEARYTTRYRVRWLWFTFSAVKH